MFKLVKFVLVLTITLSLMKESYGRAMALGKEDLSFLVGQMDREVNPKVFNALLKFLSWIQTSTEPQKEIDTDENIMRF